MADDLLNRDWDQPADSRYGPFPLAPLAVSAPGLAADAGPGRLGLALDPREFGVWGKITGRSGPLYAWQEVQQDTTGSNWVLSPGGLNFPTTYNAYEENGSTAVGTGRVVWLRRTSGLGGQAYAFKDDGAGGGGGTTTITVQGINPGTGDSTVSLTGVSILTADLTSGLGVSGAGATAGLSLQAARFNHAGGINLVAQTLGAGDKTFTNSVIAQQALSAGGSPAVSGAMVVSSAGVLDGRLTLKDTTNGDFWVWMGTGGGVGAPHFTIKSITGDPAYGVDGVGGGGTGQTALVTYQKPSPPGGSGTLSFRGGILIAWT